jgi:SNF2 family DNA or RNA helicase
MTQEPYILKPFQEQGVAYLVSRQNALLADEMGLGKTVQSLAAFSRQGFSRFLIICPASLTAQWARECNLWFPDIHTFVMPKGLKEFPLFESYIVISSYNRVANIRAALRKGKYQGVILDEAHFLKDHKTQRTKAVLGNASPIPKDARVYLLTGTPVLNRPIDLYLMLRRFAPEILDQYKNYRLYIMRYCGYQGKGASNIEDLQKRLSQFMLRRLRVEVLEQLPDIVTTTVPVELPQAELEDLNDEIDNGNQAIARNMTGQAKVKTIIEYVTNVLQTGEKVLLICYHKETIKRLAEEFKTQSVSLTGSDSLSQKEKALGRFKEDDSCRLLIGQIKVVGFGVDGLQHVCNRIIFGELDWSPATMDQTISRLTRIGQKALKVFVDYIILKNTIEEKIVEVLTKKTKIINVITGDENRMAKLPKKSNTAEDTFRKAWGALGDAIIGLIVPTHLGVEGPNEDGNDVGSSEIRPAAMGVQPENAPSKLPVSYKPVPIPPAFDPPIVPDPEAPPAEDLSEKVFLTVTSFISMLGNLGVPQADATRYYRESILKSSKKLGELTDDEKKAVIYRIEHINVDEVAMTLAAKEDITL